MKTQKEVTEIEEIKQANEKVKFGNKTFTYKQLFKTLFFIALLIAAFIGGWTTKCYSDTQYETTIQNAVEIRTEAFVQSLKETK